jgi:hypothetical protein
VLLELGCQNTSRRYWWDFTAGQLAEDERPAATLAAAGARSASATNGSGESNGHYVLPTLTLAEAAPPQEPEPMSSTIDPDLSTISNAEPAAEPLAEPVEAPAAIEHLPLARPITSPDALKEAFVRQLQLDRLTLRQMRSLLMSEDARRAIEIAVGATEATYERLALILFGADLPQLLGKPIVPPAAPTMSAEERLELQREKARIRARLRRAAIKAAKLA